MNASNFTQYPFQCPGDSDIVRSVKVMTMMSAAGFGVFGNVLVVFIAVKYIRRTNIHHLIVNMAVSDTLVILLYTFLNVPPLINKLAWLMIPDFTFASNLCRTLRAFEYTSKSVSLITLVIISIERYRATRVTALRLRPYTMRQKVAAVTCSWGLSMASSIIAFFTVDIYSRNGSYFCNYVHNTLKSRIWFTTILITLVFSFSITLVLSILTSLRLRRPSVLQANLTDAQRQVRAKRIANAVRMVVCSTLLYGSCYSLLFFWLAFFLNKHINGFSIKFLDLRCSALLLISFMHEFLMALNSCLSPYIFIAFLPEFRESTKRLLFCKQSTEPVSMEQDTAGVEEQGNDNHSRNSAMQSNGLVCKESAVQTSRKISTGIENQEHEQSVSD